METLIGKRFGQLVVIEESLGYRISLRGKRTPLCRVMCDCGESKVVLVKNLKSGNTRTCHRSHGGTGTPEYETWKHMKSRCYNPNHDSYKYYGGRGIEVCERWRNSFPAFLKDMGRRPEGKTLDRYPDPDGNYEPANCRWATWVEQSNNKSGRIKPVAPGIRL